MELQQAYAVESTCRWEGKKLATFGEKVRLLRKARGWTLQDLSDQTGLSKGYISELERGEAGYRGETLEQFSKIFDVAPSMMIEPSIDLDRLSLMTDVLDGLADLPPEKLEAVLQMIRAFRS